MVTGTDHVYRAIGHPKLPKTSSHRLLFPITSRSPAPYPFRSRIACTSRLASNTRTMAIGLVTGSYTIRYENTDQNLTGTGEIRGPGRFLYKSHPFGTSAAPTDTVRWPLRPAQWAKDALPWPQPLFREASQKERDYRVGSWNS